MPQMCTICSHIHIGRIHFKHDETKPIRVAHCDKYECTLQPTQGTFAPNTICRQEDGFEKRTSFTITAPPGFLG